MIVRLGGPVVAQAVLQATQAALIGAIALTLPTERAAAFGIAVSMIALAVFLAEMGYPQLLTRAVARGDAWLSLWRRALTSRLIASGLAAPLLLLLPSLDATLELAQPLLMTAALALVASTLSPLPLAIGIGATRLIIAGFVARAAVMLAGAGALIWHPEGDWWIIASAINGGWIVQTIVLAPVWWRLPVSSTVETPDNAQEASSILAIAILAALQDRAQLVALSMVGAEALVVRLMLPLALLGGAATLFAQLDRLLFAASLRGESAERLAHARTAIAISAQVLAAAMALIVLLIGPPLGWAERAMIMVALAEWSLAIAYQEFGSRRLAEHTYAAIIPPTAIVVGVSLGLQLAAAWLGSVFAIAAVRLLSCLAVGWIGQRGPWRPVWPLPGVAALAALSAEATLVGCVVILVWGTSRIVQCLSRMAKRA
ncbi:MAG: hypothetical protein SF002_04890 [Alphaproteobacteria bacterium]|nr:hypothetical protein [Alphaproteobacteria bacterium]